MTKPIIANNAPTDVDLVRGQKYFFCTCGHSANQPFCDGSHKGTGFTPKTFVAEEDGKAWLCCCKHTKNQPFCDGSHKQFTAEQVGSEGPGLQ